MNPELLAKLEKLAAAGISILPVASLEHHFVFTRGEMAVLVEKRGDRFGGIGSPGRITANGFEPLVDDGTGLTFVFKGERNRATEAQSAEARALLQDLKQALA